MNSLEGTMARLRRERDPAPPDDLAARHPVSNDDRPAKSQRAAKSPSCLPLDVAALRRAGYLTPATMHTELAENYRHLKRPLLLQGRGRQNASSRYHNLIGITSALSGEGKTFTAFNLAMSLAMERDHTVLLLDGDPLKRSLTRLVGLDEALGLMDLLVAPALTVGEVMITTELPTLRLIPAGHRHHPSTELLASASMQAMAADLSSRYRDRIVLFDLPPLLVTNQASVLARLMGQILLVVDPGKSSPTAIQDALARLEPEQPMALVLNRQ
ncbi:MAG: AAA family ATPase [Candidatus Competibacteraceae bacterium]